MYEIVVLDSRDIDSDWGAQSSLFTGENISEGWKLLLLALETTPTIFSWFVIGPDNSILVRYNYSPKVTV